MYQLGKVIEDDEILHEKKHQPHKLDHTKDKNYLGKEKKNFLLENYLIVILKYNDH